MAEATDTEQIVTVCIGQCGNQIGFAFLDALASFYGLSKARSSSTSPSNAPPAISGAVSRFFRETPQLQMKTRPKLEQNGHPVEGTSTDGAKPPMKSPRQRSKGATEGMNSKSHPTKHGMGEPSIASGRASQKGSLVLSDGDTPKASASQSRKQQAPLRAIPFTARAIVIDTEAKVLKTISEKASRSKTWQYAEYNLQCSAKTGAANNWAFGYYGHGPGTYENVSTALRSEVNRCTNFQGFLVIQSLAGGTGSGLGSFVTERMREDFPDARIVNVVVWPFRTGEVIVQNYNIIFTISSLYKVSDALLVLRNDDLHQICSKRLGLDTVSLDDMNHVVAYMLLNMFHTTIRRTVSAVGRIDASSRKTPSQTEVAPHYKECTTVFQALVAHLCQHRAFKLVTLRYTPQVPSKAIPFSVFTWPSLLKHLSQMQLTDVPIDENLNWDPPTAVARSSPSGAQLCVAQILILRGLPQSESVDMVDFSTKFCSPQSVEHPLQIWSARDSISYEKSALLLSNSKAFLPDMTRICDRVHTMYYHQAYVHHYVRFGMSKQAIEAAIVFYEKVMTAYKLL
ncbi:tubulin nucleotide-binding domain-like protein [Gonapodya prolifera JEL478]|uniref:Tubulin delta chain n=1 Tax=Gonapodya prolifera (strain JEL478) TaxID=1344416 RepID=A0A139A4F4_GONPJ|nr:tubulin nucleotide-binding domain-like protein [Gonapodya prolifera JEL478]|eukprot:KXS11670.1 tubulin nucleotide-binding domain-like protein [Gonapodya prolifera JEL478]